MPYATSVSVGGFILDSTQMEMNAGVLSILDSVLVPATHALTSHSTTVSAGQFLKGTGVNTYAWSAHGLTYSDVGADAVNTASGLMTSHTGTYNHTNYNTAYGWGNHASAGYAPLASPTFTGTVTLPGAKNFKIFPAETTPIAGQLGFGDGTGWKFQVVKGTDNAVKLVTFLDTGKVGIQS